VSISFWADVVSNICFRANIWQFQMPRKPQAFAGRLQTYPSRYRQVEATTINHVHRGTLMHHVAICRTTTIHLKTKICKTTTNNPQPYAKTSMIRSVLPEHHLAWPTLTDTSSPYNGNCIYLTSNAESAAPKWQQQRKRLKGPLVEYVGPKCGCSRQR
jgi:hypothetical protein